MRIFSTTILLMVLFNIGTIKAATEEIPSYAQTYRLSIISVNHAWMLGINKDGSGGLQYGSSGGDGADFPKGTFKTQDVYNKLKDHCNPADSNTPCVFFEKIGATSNTGALIMDQNLVKQLFETAATKCVPINKGRFQLLLDKYPF